MTCTGNRSVCLPPRFPSSLLPVSPSPHLLTDRRSFACQGDHARALAALDRSRVNNETKERGIDDIRKDLELASIDADQLLANQVNLDMQIKVTAARPGDLCLAAADALRSLSLGINHLPRFPALLESLPLSLLQQFLVPVGSQAEAFRA